MAFGATYDNDYDESTSTKKQNSTVFSPITFTNQNTILEPVRFSISYYNNVMQISIDPKALKQQSLDYFTYDRDKGLRIYLSYTKAYIMYKMINKLISKENPEMHNVAVDTAKGIFKVSDGSEYGTKGYCFSIISADDQGNPVEYVYETKSEYTGIYNYNKDDKSFDCVEMSGLEIQTLMMVFNEYYKASSYAITGSIANGLNYRYTEIRELLNTIAGKNGVSRSTNSNRTFLADSGARSTTVDTGVKASEEYSVDTFDNIASGM